MSVWAIIPARGGSKGVPRKNVRLLAGKPLLQYAIDAAKQSALVTRVIVSTDDDQIQAVAEQNGASVIMRPAELSGDDVSSELALLHTLETEQAAGRTLPDYVVFLQCTAPLMLSGDIDGAIQLLESEEADCCFVGTPFKYFLWQDPLNAQAINHDAEERQLSQHRDLQLKEAGSVYVMNTDGLLKHKHRFFGKTVIYPIDHHRVWEVDDPIDFHVVEALLREHQRQSRLDWLPHPIRGLVLDFDGVFTDNTVELMGDGSEAVSVHRGDGMGVSRLLRSDISSVVLSTEKHPVVGARCKKLGIEYRQGLDDKLQALQEWMRDHHLASDQVVYLGNDVNDLGCLQAVGCGVVVADAHEDVKHAAHLVLENPGGHGAVRELIDLILEKNEQESA